MHVACVAAPRLTLLRCVSRYPIVHCDRDRICRKKTDFRNVPARAYTSFITKCNFTSEVVALAIHRRDRRDPRLSTREKMKSLVENNSCKLQREYAAVPPFSLYLSLATTITNPMYRLQLSDATSICRCCYRRRCCLIKGKHK